MHKVYLSLGSNVGNRRAALDKAVQMLAGSVGVVLRCSSYIETEPWGFSSPNRFLNACVCVSTLLQPQELLRATQEIERMLGRTSKSADGIYHDRTIDIDILLYDDITIDTPQLHIPHPLMWKRDFVMRPLMEIIDAPYHGCPFTSQGSEDARR